MDNVQKTVLYCPWSQPIKNFLHHDHRTAPQLMNRLVGLIARPGLFRFVALTDAAIKG